MAKKDGLVSIIKYEGDNETLIWKHPVEDFNMGTQLIVHETQEAIFFRDGQALDLFGAGRYTLETQKLPLLEKIYKLSSNTEETFHSEVYYINLAVQMGIKWGTDSKVRLFDPASGLHIELGACGEFSIRVIDSRKLLLKVIGTTDFLTQNQLLGDKDSKGFFRAMIMAQVKSLLARCIREKAINILEIDEHLIALSDLLRDKINVGLGEYGLTMPEFYVSRILTPDDDSNYQRMREQYAEQYLFVRQEQIKRSEAEAAQQRKSVEALTDAQLKKIEAQGEADALRIKKAAEADALRMQAEAEALEMQLKGYTYQQETSRQVGMEAMKNGIGGSEGGGLGDVAGLGVALGAMSGVINMTKEALEPSMSAAKQSGQSIGNIVSDAWNCECGQEGIRSKYCPECGRKRPESAISNKWDCICGLKGIQTKFCPECGRERPASKSFLWNCECGEKGITSNYCPNCGRKKGGDFI